MIRLATLKDLNEISAIYDKIHDEEESGQVTIGWNRAIYPTKKMPEKRSNWVICSSW